MTALEAKAGVGRGPDNSHHRVGEALHDGFGRSKKSGIPLPCMPHAEDVPEAVLSFDLLGVVLVLR